MSEVDRSISHVLLQRPDDGQVLTVRHQPASWHSPGLLTVIDDRLEADEFLDEGATRKLAEEIGIQVPPDGLRFCQLPHFHAADGERVIGAVFIVRDWDGEPCNREPRTHSERVWVAPARGLSPLHLGGPGRFRRRLAPQQHHCPRTAGR
ncbi:NUDIX domain-containing protein [Streptomyces sp. NPDC059385]|uniref:NUDIX domain-containing protein n=1 Tax=Streptomyces sp. NPDC059385 TaxID=3346817 RepID=UPI003684BDE2